MEIQLLLRSLIREVIAEVLQEMRLPAKPQPSPLPESAEPVAEPSAIAQITQGAVTEKLIERLSREQATTLRVAPNVAITPLAREKARALQIVIERGN